MECVELKVVPNVKTESYEIRLNGTIVIPRCSLTTSAQSVIAFQNVFGGMGFKQKTSEEYPMHGRRILLERE